MNPLILAALAVASPAQADDHEVPDSARVRVEVVSYTTCEGLLDDYNFGDIPGGEIIIRNSTGAMLGVGELNLGRDTANSCVFTGRVDLEPDTDGFYEVTVGANDSDPIYFTEADIIGDVLHADITLNDRDDDGEPDADSEHGSSGYSLYDEAYSAWLEIPAGEDLCPEYNDGTLNDSLINYVYPGVDFSSMWAVLGDYC